MADHNVNDLAIASLALNVELLKHLESVGVVRNDAAGLLLTSAIANTSPEHRAAVAAIFTDMLPSKLGS